MLHPVQKAWPLFRVISMDNRLEALTQLYPVEQVLEMKMTYTNHQESRIIINSIASLTNNPPKKKKTAKEKTITKINVQGSYQREEQSKNHHKSQ